MLKTASIGANPPKVPTLQHDGRYTIKAKVFICNHKKEKAVSLTGYSNDFGIVPATIAMAHRERQKHQRVGDVSVSLIPYRQLEDCVEVCNMLNDKCRTVSL